MPGWTWGSSPRSDTPMEVMEALVAVIVAVQAERERFEREAEDQKRREGK